MVSLDLHSFQNALLRLDEAWAILKADTENSIVQDAVIQRFEFSYELSWKMLKRYLELTGPNAALFDGMSFQNLIRVGSEQGLLKSGWDVWWDYRDARAATSHLDDEKKVTAVLILIPGFMAEAQYLLEQLQSRSRV